ncbi:hypothetical protein LTSEGIV_0478 [Salmonella enterica subsp. enterica serovar Give str. S5-487]|nr:hypothetical protein LTSEGIV_0478 [Salmonella enterica subsp. enterica serovar Give str. S5-487]
MAPGCWTTGSLDTAPPGTTGSLDTAAWKLLILNLEDVNARIYGRFSLFLISAV